MWQEGSESERERESNDELKISNKSQKRGRGKLRGNYSKGSTGRCPDLLQLTSSSSSYGFMLSKKTHTGGIRLINSVHNDIGCILTIF